MKTVGPAINFFLFRINTFTLLQLEITNQVYVTINQHLVDHDLFSTTSSIKPNFFASIGVIKLSLSKAILISSTPFPVCFE